MQLRSGIIAVGFLSVAVSAAANGLPEDEDRGYDTVPEPGQILGEWRYIGTRSGVFLLGAPETESLLEGRKVPVNVGENVDVGMPTIKSCRTDQLPEAGSHPGAGPPIQDEAAASE